MFAKFFNKIHEIVQRETTKFGCHDVRFELRDEDGSELLCLMMGRVPMMGERIFFGIDVPNERAKGKTFKVMQITECHNHQTYNIHYMVDLQLLFNDGDNDCRNP